ncbi:MAG TPA: EamA family transporter [Reyranella sp.]|nr:EamA family transporter [Reyranella sp.]
MNKHYFSLWLGILTGVGGQMLLKAGAGAPDFVAQLTDWHTLIGLGLYGAATVCYLIAIRRIPLSVAFPSISLSYIVVMIIGGIVFGEAVTVAKIAGVVLIGVGVWVLNR